MHVLPLFLEVRVWVYISKGCFGFWGGGEIGLESGRG